MRPVILPDATVRAETTMAFYEDAASNHGRTTVAALTGIVKVPGTGPKTMGLGVVARLTVAGDKPTSGAPNTVFANPLVGVTYATAIGSMLRLNATGAVSVPVGGGGGDDAGISATNARSKGALARSGMENPIYGVDDFTFAPGVGAAIVTNGLVMQLDLTVAHGVRVRGAQKQPEASKTNLTGGFHAGYFVHPNVSVGAEIHYQRWLNAPFAVEKDATDVMRDNLTVAFGPRVHVPLGSAWARPGVSYARGLDKPMAASSPNYHVVQLDVPMTF